MLQAERYAKFWITPVQLAKSRGFRSSELSEIMGLIVDNRSVIEEKWNEHFGRKG